MSSGSLDYTGEGDQALRALVGSGSTLQLACGFCLLWALLSAMLGHSVLRSLAQLAPAPWSEPHHTTSGRTTDSSLLVSRLRPLPPPCPLLCALHHRGFLWQRWACCKAGQYPQPHSTRSSPASLTVSSRAVLWAGQIPRHPGPSPHGQVHRPAGRQEQPGCPRSAVPPSGSIRPYSTSAPAVPGGADLSVPSALTRMERQPTCTGALITREGTDHTLVGSRSFVLRTKPRADRGTNPSWPQNSVKQKTSCRLNTRENDPFLGLKAPYFSSSVSLGFRKGKKVDSAGPGGHDFHSVPC